MQQNNADLLFCGRCWREHPIETCAYQLSQNANPLDIAMDCIQAYHTANPLTHDELRVLPDLIAARSLSKVPITGWRLHLSPRAAAVPYTPRGA